MYTNKIGGEIVIYLELKFDHYFRIIQIYTPISSSQKNEIQKWHAIKENGKCYFILLLCIYFKMNNK